MTRAQIKMDRETKALLDDCKQDGETWDDTLRRLAQLDRATRVGAGSGN
jgi:hypothetical protein